MTQSSYLFRTRSTHFELENISNTHGQWVSSKFTMNFKLTLLISNWIFFPSPMSLKLFWNSPKFSTQPLLIDFELRNTSKRILIAFIQFKMHHTHLELIIFGVFLVCLWLFFVISGQCHVLGYWIYYINSLNYKV